MDIPHTSESEDEIEEDIFPKHLTDQLLLEFLDDYLSGVLPPTITSEELQQSEKTTLSSVPMHRVVASNFHEL